MGAFALRQRSAGGFPPRPAADAKLLFDDAYRLHLTGRIPDAIAKYRLAIHIRPDFADGHTNLGAALIAEGTFDDAIAHCRRALSIEPANGAAHANLGAALAAKRSFTEAINHYQTALAITPGNAGVHYNLAIAFVAQGRVNDAIAHYRFALALQPDCAHAHNNLANLLEAQGASDLALAHYGSAVALNPRHAEAHNNLGNMLRERGDLSGALGHYNRAIENAPANPEIHFHRSEIRTFHAGDPELTALETLARDPKVSMAKRPYIEFALAKALEDTGDYPRAFAHLAIGNGLKRRQIRYDENLLLQRFHDTAVLFDRELLDGLAGEGDPSPTPIFVVGMPRSGSTLIEQILASHPQVHGAGELPNLPHAAAGFSISVAGLKGGTMRRIAANYLSSLPALPPGKTRIVDKLPSNLFAIGLIRLILPNAKIIHSVRNPVDTCFSCYSRLFSDGQHFSYDLAELGRYYRRYAELMAHWRSVLPSGVMLEVSYEDVVGDLEGQTRRLLDFCGLSWDDRCLSFHRTARPVKTASAVQVRRPLFRTSVDRWRRYEVFLGPLLQELGDLVPAESAEPSDSYETPLGLGDEACRLLQ